MVTLIHKKNIKLAESPVIFQEKLYFVDIDSGGVCTYDFATNRYESIHVADSVGSVMFTSKGNCILTQEDGITIRDQSSRAITKNYGLPPEFIPGVHRFNDGKIGPDGRLYAGVMIKDSAQRRANPGAASLWSLDSEGRYTKMLDSLTTPNGMAWLNYSNTESKFYYIDSRRQNILSGIHTFSSTPKIEITEELISFDTKQYETPDGMTLLKNGELLVVFYRSQLLLRIDPSSRSILEEIKVSYPYPTSVVSANGKLFITHAQHGENEGCVSVIAHSLPESVEPFLFQE